MNNFKPILNLLKIVGIFYLTNKVLFYFFASYFNAEKFYYTSETIFSFFTLCALIILFILVKVKEKSPDNVGMTFLLATTVKLGFCYWMVFPIIHPIAHTKSLEKIYFFAIFAIFLIIETLLTIRILDNK